MDRQELDFDKHIDPAQLDVECVRQAETFFKWAERAAAAKNEMERQKFEWDVLTAKLMMEARKDPELFGIGKVTEAYVDAGVRCCKRYSDAGAKYYSARAEAELLARAVEAMEQKKKMLDLLVSLHGQEYFAGPSTPHSLTEAYREFVDRRQADVNDRQRAMTRKRVTRG